MRRRYLVSCSFTAINGNAGVGTAFITLSQNLTQKIVQDEEAEILKMSSGMKYISTTNRVPL